MRFRWHAAVTTLLLSLAVTAPAFAQGAGADTSRAGTLRARMEPAPRTGGMFGFGGGYGLAGPRGENAPDPEPGGTFHLRVGTGVNSRAVVGIEYVSWSVNPTDTTTFNFTAAGPSLTWYWPSNLYVRGMVGWGSAEASWEEGTPPAHTMAHVDDDGFALLGAVGWEWRYRRRFAIAPEAQIVHIGLGNSASFAAASGSLSLNVYF